MQIQSYNLHLFTEICNNYMLLFMQFIYTIYAENAANSLLVYIYTISKIVEKWQ